MTGSRCAWWARCRANWPISNEQKGSDLSSVWVERENWPEYLSFLAVRGVVSGMSAAIAGEGKPFGILGAYTTCPRKFSEGEMDFLQAMANFLSVANKRKQAEEELRNSEQYYRNLAQTAQAALAESEARFQVMADSVPVLLWMSGNDSLCTFFNQGWLNFRGRSLEEEFGNGWTVGVHPEDLSDCLDRYITAFNKRLDFQMEYRLLRADGEYRWVLDVGKPRFMPDGSFAGYIGSCIDITERKLAEEALRSRAAQLATLSSVLTKTNAALEKRNQELDQFAYIVSHDLKAPLRAIANLSQWMEEDLQEQLTGDAKYQMKLLRGRVHRMEALIEGILAYSRIGRVKTRKEVVDITILLETVIDSLAPPPTFTIMVEPGMPILTTERLPLEQVFTNLISNAIKHHTRPNGRVQISVVDLGDFYEFAVKDDGPGIDPQYHEKVFVIFQTLVARDQVENTGIGLSLVKKIVEDKGGIVYLESQLGEGATFRFTWPK